MGKVLEGLNEDVQQFIAKQQMFFVATAPLAADGHVNVSPKGMDSFRILGENRVGYLDMTGSGNETAAHITENQRITFMFCAFEGSANIVRLYGTGRVVLPQMPEWAALSEHFTLFTGTRQIIVADIHRISSSCGYAVPLYEYKAQRETLSKYWEAKGADALPDYWQTKNQTSIDGLEVVTPAVQ